MNAGLSNIRLQKKKSGPSLFMVTCPFHFLRLPLSVLLFFILCSSIFLFHFMFWP